MPRPDAHPQFQPASQPRRVAAVAGCAPRQRARRVAGVWQKSQRPAQPALRRSRGGSPLLWLNRLAPAQARRRPRAAALHAPPAPQRRARLEAAGQLQPAGLAASARARARQNGAWESLNAAEAGTVPDDLATALAADAPAARRFAAFLPSARKAMLAWVLGAKQPATRARRVAETVRLAVLGKRANFDREWQREAPRRDRAAARLVARLPNATAPGSFALVCCPRTFNIALFWGRLRCGAQPASAGRRPYLWGAASVGAAVEIGLCKVQKFAVILPEGEGGTAPAADRAGA